MQDWIQANGAQQIGEDELFVLVAALGPVSARYLRRLLRESGLRLSPLVEGVRQDSLGELERTLLALEEEYRRGRRAAARREVLTARQHAEWALRGKADPIKEEMLSWMRVWLQNPGVFPAWLALRKRVLAGQSP